MVLGAISAYTGGAKISKAIIRITFWGTMAMVISAVVGYLFEINIA
jgi:VIT1/CCC1 family predicted Fe2+/Mn2+ transporter